MRLCLACHQDRLATLLDTTTHLVFVDVDCGRVTELAQCGIPYAAPRVLAERLDSLQTGTLLCGGISRQDRLSLEGRGVRVIPWLCGSLDRVAEALLSGDVAGLAMPGCPCRCRGLGPGAGGGRGHRGGRGCGGARTKAGAGCEGPGPENGPKQAQAADAKTPAKEKTP
ncbi:hypothetical protein dsx2_2363 [Desulfovibrio sp. X2]|uniref:NifB/NifX family molybdenum-iron cluster-binding protein n=1 Tax=Desulfovibrio sp. X2 TaxID=941449 RepID=UPI000358B310|nr:hypothetical protein [Desulfovibrio sp. X2]EPR43512.1 hypothetical protein dsx2_2363 [Desulfovibrio sp. X2]